LYIHISTDGGHADTAIALVDPERLKGTARMSTNTDRTLATVIGVLPALLIPVSTALADNTPMGDGMMGNGSTYGHMYGFNSAWLIALVFVVLGIVLVAVLRKTK
jgi:hypothetical protein